MKPNDDETPKPQTTIDQELEALRLVGAALASIDVDARARVVRWAYHYFALGDTRLGNF